MARAEMWAPRRHRIVRAQVGNATGGKPPLQGGALEAGCRRAVNPIYTSTPTHPAPHLL